ncbi:alpha/beta hydrolase [Agrobacterium tumefaciens]|uniref:alpha/beta fold hydrolase n=1 Tax=Agrobacterium tumefaciens TaxID=358 RepID=UPI002FD8F37C
MATTGAPRFLCVSSGGANRHDPNLGFWFRRIVIPLAGSPEALPASARDFYIELLRRTPGALKASFDYYRAIDVSIPQYRRRVAQGKLTMPVLAFSDALACGSMVENELRTLANDVFSVIIPDCGHYLAEEKPQTLLEALDAFLAAHAG